MNFLTNREEVHPGVLVESRGDDERLRAAWPGDVRFQRLGDRAVLISGVGSTAEAGRPSRTNDEEPTTTASRVLETARAAGDRRGEAQALADLGMLLAKEGRAEAALGPLHEALALRRTLGDHAGEADVLIDLAQVLDALRRASASRAALEEASRAADAGGDALARAAVLERLGAAFTRRGEPLVAAAVLDRARDAARHGGDRRHEARLLWLLAAAWADAGRPDLALPRAEASTALLQSLGASEADWYEAQTNRFRVNASTPAADAPGILRMALSATRAMATFLGSGLRTATPETYEARQASCRVCDHHTGLRCRICGCFTKAKTALLDERCPIGRW